MDTTAQHDTLLSHFRFGSRAQGSLAFDDFLVRTPLVLDYTVLWPLDLFLHLQDLQVYGAMLGYPSAPRKTYNRTQNG